MHVGLKSEAAVPIGEFHNDSGELDIEIGDEVQLTLEAIEDGHGNTRVSREKAIKQQSWNKLQDSFDNNGIEVFQEEKYYLLKKNVEIVSDEFELNGNLVKIFFFINYFLLILLSQ